MISLQNFKDQIKKNKVSLLLVLLLTISIPLTIRLVQSNQNNRSKAASNSQLEINFKISFKGITPSSQCFDNLQQITIEVIDSLNQIHLIDKLTKFEAIKNEINKYGDQVFKVQAILDNSQSVKSKLIRIKGLYSTAVVLCTNKQSTKANNFNLCNLDLSSNDIFDFSNYPLTPGDINQDDIVNSIDFSLTKNEISHSNTLSCNQRADLNLDGIVNGIDISLIKLHLLSISETINQTPSITVNPTTTTKTPTKTLSPTPTNKPIPVSSFNLETNKIITSVGRTRKIIISNILPINSTQQNATYTSSNNSIATVDNDGTISGISKGQTTISVKIGNISQTISVDVLPAGDKVFFLKSEINSETPADTIIIESNGKYGFVDAGNTTVANKFLKYLGISSIDFLLLTHWHTDHYMGFTDILTNYPVSSIYLKPYNGYDAAENTTKSLIQTRIDLFNKLKSWPNTDHKEIGKDNSFTLGNFKFDLFNTTERLTVENEPSGGYYCQNFNSTNSTNQCNENANSVATLITINGKKIYLTGDIQNQLIYTNSNQTNPVYKKIEIEAADRIIKYRCNGISKGCIDVYKLAHHGFGSESNTNDITSKLDPKYAIATTPTTKYNLWLKTYANLNKFNEFIKNNKQTLNINGTDQPNKVLTTGEGTIILNIDTNSKLSFIKLNY